MFTTHELVKFDHQFILDNMAILQNLSTVYCSIWEEDEYFGEYRKCQNCNLYYSYEDVNTNSLVSCRNCGQELSKAWHPVQVALDLQKVADHHSFSGALLLSGNEVSGFAWGRLYETDEIALRLKSAFFSLSSAIPRSRFYNAFYLEELGIVPEIRGQGHGTKLVKAVFTKPLTRYPNTPVVLSTHKDSPAVYLYRKLGFTEIAPHPSGQGRIVMAIDRIGSIKMFD